MVVNYTNIVKYLNVAFEKVDLKASMQIGLPSNASANGIYFYYRDAEVNQALSAEAFDKIIEARISEVDFGAVEAVSRFGIANQKLINRGAKFIPLEKCNELSELLGV